jgi:hypothetical protein
MLRPAVVAFISIAIAGCARVASSPALPPEDTVYGAEQAKPSPLCIKLTHGVVEGNGSPGPDCTGGPGGPTAVLCYPNRDNACTHLPKVATVRLTEKRYKGKIVAALESKKLPPAVLASPYYPGALCGDKGTTAFSEDVLVVKPADGHGPKRSFTITDKGRRHTSAEISNDCIILFYDQSNNVETLGINMLTGGE